MNQEAPGITCAGKNGNWEPYQGRQCGDFGHICQGTNLCSGGPTAVGASVSHIHGMVEYRDFHRSPVHGKRNWKQSWACQQKREG